MSNSNTSQIVPIATEPYLTKYAIKKLPTRKVGNSFVIRLPRSLVYVGTHETNFLETYHDRREQFPSTKFELPSGTILMRYATIRYLKERFFNEAMEFVFLAISMHQKVIWALKQFYKKYNLTDDDYEIETMRRRWNRYKKSALVSSQGVLLASA